MRTRLYLVERGVPFDVSFSLDDDDMTAWAIIYGELAGGKWDWSTMSWKPQS